MANLIPPDAKRELKHQYWIRVATVWAVLIGAGFVVASILHAPTFVLVQSQLTSVAGQFDSAKEKEDSFNVAQKTILDANGLASLLSTETASTTAVSEVLAVLDAIGGFDIEIHTFNFTTESDVITKILVNGEATTRAALANFSDDLESHPLFAEAEVPISNLAKDRDITFNITIIPST